jgi:hypothetical protein
MAIVKAKYVRGKAELFSPTESTNYKHLSIACIMVHVGGGSGSQKVTHFTED